MADTVEVTITANARGLGYSTSGDGDRVGLGEIRFRVDGGGNDFGLAIDHSPATQVDLGNDVKYLQLDLSREKTVNSLLVMRDNTDMRTFKGVVYQLSTTEDFSSDVTTVFHNDIDDLHGLRLGESTHGEHQETEKRSLRALYAAHRPLRATVFSRVQLR